MRQKQEYPLRNSSSQWVYVPLIFSYLPSLNVEAEIIEFNNFVTQTKINL